MISLLFWILPLASLCGAETNVLVEDVNIVTTYLPEEFVYFSQVFKDLAKSDRALKMIFDFFNQPTARREFLDQVFEISRSHVLTSSVDDAQDVEELSDDVQKRVGHVYEDGESDASSEEIDDPYKEPLQVGSIRGTPGIDFPDYHEIPLTSFTCADKYIPGFYADLETGCQEFHVCWPHRMESFLCPIGTTFNQAILACDYWYSNNCSLAPLYFDVNVQEIWHEELPKKSYEKMPFPEEFPHPEEAEHVELTHGHFLEHPEHLSKPLDTSWPDIDWSRIVKFLPIKSKVTIYSDHEATKESINLKHSDFKVEKPEHMMQETAMPKEHAHKTKVVHEFVEPSKYAGVLVHDILEETLSQAKHALKYHGKHKSHGKQKFVKIEKPKVLPLPEIDPKFVVKPVSEKPKMKHRKPIAHVQKVTVAAKLHKPHKTVKKAPLNVPEIVMGVIEAAGTVLQRDILPLTRQALIKSHVKVSRPRKH